MPGSRSNKMSKVIRTIVGIGLLTAIVVILQLIGSFIKLGTFSVSLVLMPIVIGAALYGWYAGPWLGFVFGVVVLLSGDASLFLSINPAGTVITVLLKGILAGCAAVLVYKWLAPKYDEADRNRLILGSEESSYLKKLRVILGVTALAALFFLLVSPLTSYNAVEEKMCAACGQTCSVSESYCSACGEALPEQSLDALSVCTATNEEGAECGYKNAVGAQYCASCGAELPFGVTYENLINAKADDTDEAAEKAPITADAGLEGNQNLLTSVIYGSSLAGSSKPAFAVFVIFAVLAAVCFLFATLFTTVYFRGYMTPAYFGLGGAVCSVIALFCRMLYTFGIIGSSAGNIAWGTYVSLILAILTGILSAYVLSDKKARTAESERSFGYYNNNAVLAAAVVCPVVNTGVFLVGCRLFFYDTIKQWAAGAGFGDNAAAFMLFGLVGLNFVFELFINILLSPAIVTLIKTGRKTISK